MKCLSVHAVLGRHFKWVPHLTPPSNEFHTWHPLQMQYNTHSSLTHSTILLPPTAPKLPKVHTQHLHAVHTQHLPTIHAQLFLQWHLIPPINDNYHTSPTAPMMSQEGLVGVAYLRAVWPRPDASPLAWPAQVTSCQHDPALLMYDQWTSSRWSSLVHATDTDDKFCPIDKYKASIPMFYI